MKTPQQLAKERQHIFEAFAEGQEVQSRWVKPLGWIDRHDLEDLFDPEVEWRIKPKKLECWVNVYDKKPTYGHDSKERAMRLAGKDATRIAVHMVEADD